jgi:hypothetical protein
MVYLERQVDEDQLGASYDELEWAMMAGEKVSVVVFF